MGDQDGDGRDDFEYRKACPCSGKWDGDPAQHGGSYCETVSVTRSWKHSSDPDKTIVECINYNCNVCEVETEIEEHESPEPYNRYQFCKCS